MSAWSTDQLQSIGRAEELQLTSYRSDNSRRPFVTMWVVRSGDDLYVRSAGGPDRTWYRRALESGRGTIRAGGTESEVSFIALDADGPQDAIDAAYHAKYDRYGQRIVGSVVGPGAHQVTIKLVRSEP